MQSKKKVEKTKSKMKEKERKAKKKKLKLLNLANDFCLLTFRIFKYCRDS